MSHCRVPRCQSVPEAIPSLSFSRPSLIWPSLVDTKPKTRHLGRSIQEVFHGLQHPHLPSRAVLRNTDALLAAHPHVQCRDRRSERWASRIRAPSSRWRATWACCFLLTHKRSGSAWGLAAVFGLAGFMGCILATASLFVSIFNLFGRLLQLLGLLNSHDSSVMPE